MSAWTPGLLAADGAIALLAAGPRLVLAAEQRVLDPAGPQAEHIAGLWHLTLGVCLFVFVAVLAALIYALWRAPRAPASSDPDLRKAPRAEAGPSRAVLGAVISACALLLFLIVASVFTERALAHLSYRNALHIEVTANQWWWEARYDDAQASNVFTTANEIHIPVGRPVVLTLKSSDVIHSFWVPNLHGKKDLIPGRTATLHLQADKAGTYRGQCAEFCGYQHTFMAFLVIAEPPERYEAWAVRQRAPAAEPAGSRELRGKELFLTTNCVMCHTIEGTGANARKGPDLTHLALRETLAAGTLRNTPEDLRSWIRDPQAHKPGANMPASNLAPQDIEALVAYLRGLS
jgi:cytochrome c oxidase subunit 2